MILTKSGWCVDERGLLNLPDSRGKAMVMVSGAGEIERRFLSSEIWPHDCGFVVHFNQPSMTSARMREHAPEE